MQAILDYLVANPLYAVIAVILLLLLVISLVKKTGKLILLAVALNLAYVYYLHDLSKPYLDKARDIAEEVGDEAGNLMDKAGLR